MLTGSANPPNHIVFTTIFRPDVLNGLLANLQQHGRLNSVRVWVVGDRKTPAATPVLCAEVARKGLQTTYLDIATQDTWGKRFPEFYARIPYDNETRRNIGYLFAIEAGCERLISIDDDNWPVEGDFVGAHLAAGRAPQVMVLEEPHGYHNICEHLDFCPSRTVYPRGFPFRLRSQNNQPSMQAAPAGAIVGVNAGLWLREPDVDATTWLNGRVEAVRQNGPASFVLGPGTWSPINTQNTSVVRALVPGFLCVPMGWPVPGGKIQRYGDIWGGYFLQAIMQKSPYLAMFGSPLVDHRRNPHDYVDDLRHEFWGMVLTDWLLGVLRTEFRPGPGDSVCDRVQHLAEFLAGRGVSSLPLWCPSEVAGFVRHTAENLTAWGKVCQKLLGG